MAKAKQALEELSSQRWVRTLAEHRRDAEIERQLDQAQLASAKAEAEAAKAEAQAATAAAEKAKAEAAAATAAAEKARAETTTATHRALLTVLRGRGLVVTPVQERRILSCLEATQVDAWLTHAATATSVDELLNG